MSDRFAFERAPGHLIRRAHQIAVAVFTEEVGAHGVTPVQFAILNALMQQPVWTRSHWRSGWRSTPPPSAR